MCDVVLNVSHLICLLLGQYLLVEVIHKVVLVVVADGHRGVTLEDDVVLFYLADLVQVDDERAVDAHELAGRQMFLNLLHAQQHDNGLIPVVAGDAQVFAHGLDIEDVLDVDAHNLVVALDIDDVVVGVDLGIAFALALVEGVLAYFADVLDFLGGGFKFVEAVGLEQVPHCVGLVA